MSTLQPRSCNLEQMQFTELRYIRNAELQEVSRADPGDGDLAHKKPIWLLMLLVGSFQMQFPLAYLAKFKRTRAISQNVSSYIPTLGNLVFVCLVPFLILSGAAALVFYMKAKPQTGNQAAQIISEVPAKGTTLPPQPTQYAPVPGRAVWCVYELEEVATRDYSPADMPRHLCSAFVCAYATLVRRGRLAPRDSYKDAVKQLQSAARDPRRDVYLALAGPSTPSGVASETASSTRYRTQLCEHLEDVLEDLDLQGALFHWPSPYHDTLGDAVVAQQFFGAMETCLGAFSKKMALVVPKNEAERKHFFPFIDGGRLSYNVVFWTHDLHEIPGPGTMAHCAVNLPDIVNLQTDLRKSAPALHDQAVVTASLRALQFRLLVTTGPNKLSSAEPNKTEVLPYTAVCRETVPNQSQWRWSMSKEDGCVHGTYQNQWTASLHDASDIYFANFTTGVALFDMAYDDFQGICGQKHPLTSMIVRGLNISHIIH